MNKFKVKDKVWVLFQNERPEHLSKNRYNDDFDMIAMVVGYVETSPLIKERYRHYYLKQSFKYVICHVTRFGGFHPIADLVKEEDLKRYYGHDYDIEFNDIYKNFDNELKRIVSVTPLKK